MSNESNSSTKCACHGCIGKRLSDLESRLDIYSHNFDNMVMNVLFHRLAGTANRLVLVKNEDNDPTMSFDISEDYRGQLSIDTVSPDLLSNNTSTQERIRTNSHEATISLKAALDLLDEQHKQHTGQWLLWQRDKHILEEKIKDLEALLANSNKQEPQA